MLLVTKETSSLIHIKIIVQELTMFQKISWQFLGKLLQQDRVSVYNFIT